MLPTRLLVFAVLLLLGAVPVQVGAQPAGVEYKLTIACPNGTSASLNNNNECPIRAIDGMDLMGDPSLAVDPLRPENLILASLHGQSAGSQGGPSVKSRTGQVFTTFTSQSGGTSWIDNPYVPPEDLGPGVAYGIHPQVTIDPYGKVYVGSLYAKPNGQTPEGANAYEYVIGAQKFESIDTIDEEQFSSSGGYNAEYITPVFLDNQINQMWFLFNPITDNMTLVWHETVPKPPVPPCETDSAYLVNAEGNYVKFAPATTEAGVYRESNGIPDLQTEISCPANPDDQFFLAPAATASLNAAAGQGSRPGASLPALGAPAAPTAVPSARPAVAPAKTATPTASAAVQQDDANETPRGVIGLVWTTSASDTPYTYQDLDFTIGPCSGSTNPVLSFGWLYIGCVVDTSEGEFRWAPGVENGTVQLFRMDPDGGEPQYMGQAPDMVGPPKLGVRSDGRLALVAAGASDQGALLFSAAFGRYEPALARIDWSKQLAIGHDILPLDPEMLIVRGDIQDIIYREQSGALHVILKTTVNYLGQGTQNAQDSIGAAAHIRKTIIALDEEYGLLATVPLDIGNILVRSQDSFILNSPEGAFQDLSDDFLQLPSEPFSFDGKDLGDNYQREFFAIADYGTILFAELIEETTLRAVGQAPPPQPPAPVASPATTNLVAPVAGLTALGVITGSLAVHRRKNPNAAITKGE